MWVEKRELKNGNTSYRAIETYIDRFTGKRRRVSVTMDRKTTATMKWAQAEIQKKIQAAQEEKTDKAITLAELLDEYLEYRAPELKISSKIRNRTEKRRLLKVFPKDIFINLLTLSIAQKAITKLNYLSLQSATSTVSLFKRAMKHAKRMKYVTNIDYIQELHVTGKRKTVDDVKKARNKFLTRDELANVLDQLKKIDMRYGLMMEFVSLTGLRFGECVALRYKDFYDDYIDVNGTIIAILPAGHKEKRGTPKTLGSVRMVALNKRSIEILKHMRAQNLRMKSWGNTDYHEQGYFFTANTGNPVHLSSINRALKKIDFPRPLSTHIFRHTHISLLAEMGVPLKTIMDRVGHTSPKTTLMIYSHVSEDMRKSVASKLDSLYG